MSDKARAFFERHARKAGPLADLSKNSKQAKSLARMGVLDSEDLQRIVALPRRIWAEDPSLNEVIETMTALFKAPGGQQTLRGLQAVGLAELMLHLGLFASMQVGSGKTLVTRLAPLAGETERPVLIVPANLVGKTIREFGILDKHWQSHPNYQILSYEKLSRVGWSSWLEEYNPDMVVLDEAQMAKNRSAAVTKRILRYGMENPQVQWVVLSGTITSRSILDFWHLLLLCLGPERVPLPVDSKELQSWAMALDDKIDWSVRVAPGRLSVFVEQDEGKPLAKGRVPKLAELRRGYRRRLTETEGVVATQEDTVGASIYLTLRRPELHCDIRDAIAAVKRTDTKPNGDEIESPMDMAVCIRALILGFYYRWTKEPPEEWMRRRKEWRKFVRITLEKGIKGIDSPLQVWQAVENEKLHSNGRLERWKEVQDTFKPVTTAEWVSFASAEYVAKSLEKAPPTLIWTEHTPFGRALEERMGLPYFAQQGLDSAGNAIEVLSPESSAILSMASNKKGRNLQGWSRNFLCSCPTQAGDWQQIIARTHRQGQEADVVAVDLFAPHEMVSSDFDRALANARYVQDVDGNPQKLLLADVIDEYDEKRKSK